MVHDDYTVKYTVQNRKKYGPLRNTAQDLSKNIDLKYTVINP